MLATAMVAVSGAAYAFDKLYSYTIPPRLTDVVAVGSPVLVSFGRGGRPRVGVVLDLTQAEPLAGQKELLDAAREELTLRGELLELVMYLRRRTFCTYYDAVRAVLPYGAMYRANGNTLQKQLRAEEICYAFRPTQAPLTEKQKAVSDYLQKAAEACTYPEIYAALGVGRGVVQALVQKGGAAAGERSRSLPLPPAGEKPVFTLSPEQQQVFEGLCRLLHSEKPKPALLHGVTSSGKTMVFVRLLEQTLAMGRTALVLVPEISLTPQMTALLRGVFGDLVAVQHSELNHSERLWQWRQAAAGKASIVVATRSGVFAPLDNIGLIIVDEEQEASYFSEQSPRYNAIDIARRRAARHGALLLLASATPSVETYYAAQNGQYALFELRRRYGDRPLPAVELVDMRQELRAGNMGAFSQKLMEETARNLAAGRQTILLLNKRGYRRVALCDDCGEAVQCDQCSVPMVYHKAENKLMCHYCGRTIAPPALCPKCGGPLRYVGVGTQRAEEELAQALPQARILRMDMDTVQRKNAREELLAAFRAGKFDILIGTQMVAKGLDFPNVTLVGVLGIDSLLFAQSFRANERVFSLVTQVVGRGGRGGEAGRAIVQTLDVGNRVLHLAAAQNYGRFYQEEIGFRSMGLYPPFCGLCAVSFQGEDEGRTAGGAARFLTLAGQVFAARPQEPIRALGPAPYSIVMVNGRYRYRVSLKYRPGRGFYEALGEALALFAKEKEYSALSVAVDFNQDTDT